MKDAEIAGPPRRAGICGKLLFVSLAFPSTSTPAIDDSAAAGAVLVVASPEGSADEFCSDELCPEAVNCSPAKIHTTIPQHRILIVTTRALPGCHRLRHECFGPNFSL